MFTLGEEASASVKQFITVSIIFCVTWLLIKAINLARELTLRQYDLDEKDNLKARKVYTQFRVLERIVIFIVILIAIAIALMSIEIRALMSTVDSPTGWDLRVLVREKLITFLQENYPQSLPRMRVEMAPAPDGESLKSE